MECTEYIARLARFLASDLDEPIAPDLAAHAEDCRPCSGARVEDDLVRRIRECLDQSAAPAELRERIIDRISDRR